mmetsp:Transcript_14924/g.53701  ORF Transcript_14924/g.53701 Transcript_14924/m.53701 type:complete len:286 (-) Transcript_14924:941-1798(-)|eukprot:30003-Pelagococcus_subviridis.AAC.5
MIFDESTWTSTRSRERLSNEIFSLPPEVSTASHSMPYIKWPSQWMCTPNISTWTMPSSSGKCTSASKFTNAVSSKSRMSTSVRPSLSPMNSELSGLRSTTLVKKPPWTRSLLPSLSLSATIWFAPMGIHSPIKILTSSIVMFSSSSSLMLFTAPLRSSTRPSFRLFSRPHRRNDAGRYGDETYDTSSMSVMVLAREYPFLFTSMNAPSSASQVTFSRFSSHGLAPGGYATLCTCSRISSVSFFSKNSSPKDVILNATVLWYFFDESFRPYKNPASRSVSKWSRPS